MFELLERMTTGQLVQLTADLQRDESQIAARRSAVIAVLADRLPEGDDDRGGWAVDPWDALAAELGAAQCVSIGMASAQMHRAQALRHRLPSVWELFEQGLIGQRLVDVVISRTDLVGDTEGLALLDKSIAERVRNWGRLPYRRLIEAVDTQVRLRDPDAERRTRRTAENRRIGTTPTSDGLAELWGLVQIEGAKALTDRLDQLAATVCPGDPRTLDQRRADALGPLSLGKDSMACGCGSDTCPGFGAEPDVPVLVHVIAQESTLSGEDDEPAYLPGVGVIGADELRRLAEGAARRAVSIPASAEPRYRPSRALAGFVRARDFGCRFPGCDVPSARCDIDHSVSYAAGGRTAAGNLKLLCRKHHLLKTFYGWRDTQQPDGTVIWTSPEGQLHVTRPAGAAMFAALSRSTPVDPVRCLAMPLRKRSRQQERRQRVDAERKRNREDRLREDPHADDPPPF